MTGWSLTFKGLGRLAATGWGRRAAWAVLIPFLVLQLAAPALFDAPRFALFDSYQRLFTRDQHTDAVVIVAIDDQSLKKVGQWPWPRQIQARLIAKILEAGPAALGIDMLWPEADQLSPEQWLRHIGDGRLSAPAVSELQALPRHDDLLARTLAGKPVAIGVGIPENDGSHDSGRLAPFLQRMEPPAYLTAILEHAPGILRARLGTLLAGRDPREHLEDILPDFPFTTRSIAAFDEADGVGHGMLSVIPDPDGAFRRLPMVSLVSGRPAPGLELEMLRLAVRNPSADHVDLHLSSHGVESVSVGGLDIPTQEDGSIWVNFSQRDRQRFVSAVDVLEGRVPPQRFERAMVLLGETGLGRVDLRMTPVDQIQGVEIRAQLLENILDGTFARRPHWAEMAEAGLTLFFALLLILLAPSLRPRGGLILGAAVPLCLAGLGFGLWLHSRILLDIATPMIGQAAVMMALLSAGFAQADAQRRRLRLAAAKTAGELEAAHRIQAGILPSLASVAGDARFDMDALMIPARQIGGDFFDFFKMDNDHLFFAVGDVSGKGMPAALFMALGKSLCKSCALRGEHDIGAIINRSNREISRDNPEMLFITLFAGILNLATGELRFCNAGHDQPFLLRRGEPPHSLKGVGGPPLCIVEDFDYPEDSVQLKPGDMLCVITDGITEAMTAEGDVMGRARAEEVLAGLANDISAHTATKALHDAADDFVAGADASDDLTILAVRWNGPIAP